MKEFLLKHYKTISVIFYAAVAILYLKLFFLGIRDVSIEFDSAFFIEASTSMYELLSNIQGSAVVVMIISFVISLVVNFKQKSLGNSLFNVALIMVLAAIYFFYPLILLILIESIHFSRLSTGHTFEVLMNKLT